MDRAAERRTEIDGAVTDIRGVERREGVNPESLAKIKARLIRPDGGVREKGREVVRPGTGVAFMPEDLHSIHIDAPLLNFLMYGPALEQLHRREFYKEKEERREVFPAHSDIREARA